MLPLLMTEHFILAFFSTEILNGVLPTAEKKTSTLNKGPLCRNTIRAVARPSSQDTPKSHVASITTMYILLLLAARSFNIFSREACEHSLYISRGGYQKLAYAYSKFQQNLVSYPVHAARGGHELLSSLSWPFAKSNSPKDAAADL